MSPRASKSTSFSRVEKYAMKYSGVERSTYFGKPAVKLDGQIIACMASNKSAEPDTLVVRVDFLERDLRIANEPDVYYLKPHYVNYPCVLTRLSQVSDEALKDLLESAYRYVTKKKTQSRARSR
ncbi:MAG: hypothetical protein ACJ8AK_17280 [Gemmatimonadaceae bacterium]